MELLDENGGCWARMEAAERLKKKKVNGRSGCRRTLLLL